MRKYSHGAYPAVVSRSDLTKLLYDSFPPEIHENMFPNKKVSGITNTNDGVTISCADGTSYTGSILIGADGAHSQVRKQMRLLAQHESPSLGVALDAEQPFLTTYRALWFRFPTSLGLNPGEAHESHGNGLGCQVFAGNDTAIAGVYEKLDKPTRERSRYTRADQDAIVNKWGDVQIAKNLSLKKAFESKTHADLVDLEEGVVEHWSHGRIVLAGDAAHKYTPSTGSGCNTGIVDVVVLANELSKIYNKDNATPTLDSITTAYRNYQDARQEIVAAGCKASAGATATSTWSSMGLKLFDKYILPNNTLQKILADMGASRFADSPVFDYINGAEPMIGKVPWTQPIKPDSRVAV